MKKSKSFINVLFLIILSVQVIFQGKVFAQNLKVSDNNRFLVQHNDTPFFWLGDTGWDLFVRLNRDETEKYLINRVGKGFNVIQCSLTGTGLSGGLDTPNGEGEIIFKDSDPLKPNEKYFEHVDWVVKKAEELGIYLAILPVWGHLVVNENPVFDNKSAYAYGKYLGKRYKHKSNIIWVLGGDKSPGGYENVWKAMSEGLRDGGSDYLTTYHIVGEHSSSEYFQNSDWLDLNMIQSGHISAYYDNYRLIEKDYNKIPKKPVLDGEIIYEGMPIGFCPTNERAKAHHVRVEAYWSVFAGACGVTYGSNNIWMFYDNDMGWAFWADRSWKESLDEPGSFQMHWLKDLMLSRPFLSRIPDQSLLEPQPSNGTDHLQVTRDGTMGKKDATYLMVYFPYLTHKYKILTDVIPSERLRVWWYDPRTGEAFLKGEIQNTGSFELPWGSDIQTNNTGPDWVLVLDDASKEYPAPGEIMKINE